MGNYSQQARPMRVDTPLGTDELMLEGFEAEEGLSRPYLYTLELLSENDAIVPKDILRKAISVSVVLEPGQDPFVTHGFVRSFVQLDKAEGLAQYRAEMVPAFWFLTQTADCKIFQNKSVLEIVGEVLDEAGSVGAIKHRNACSRSYTKREFCVQYRESDFNFVSRLLEDEGIFYYFEHTEDGHTLVLADAESSFKPSPAYGDPLRMDPQGAPTEQVVYSFIEEHATRSYEVMLRDYDPLQPSRQLDGTVKGSETPFDPVFDYPGYFTELDAGEYLSRVELERREKSRHRVTGTSSARGLRAGTVIELQGHFRPTANSKYYLDRVRHTAHSGAFRGWDDAGFHYSNEFTGYPSTVPFRPDIAARRPLVRGTQTAKVVGKKGEEVWVDEHGRVKVQFHWDKYGKNDENSSCWIRVSTQTAGKNWGHVEIPRIGHEVIVDFLEGNPDRPIITGSVYNAEMKTPYPLPEKGVVSGIKTKSSPKATGYNELIMDDEKDKELIRMHAQKNLKVKVLNTQSQWVGKHLVHVVKGSRGAFVDGETKVKLEEADDLGEVKEDGTWEFALGDVLVVTSNRYVEIGKKQKVRAEKGHMLHVVDGDIADTIDKGNHTTEVTNGDVSVKAKTGSITLDAAKEILLKCGGSSIKMGPAKIEMKIGGSKVTLDPASIKLEGVMIEAKANVQAVLEGGAMTQVKAGAMVQVQGGIVKIN